jgi:hypothetical protein
MTMKKKRKMSGQNLMGFNSILFFYQFIQNS